MPTFKTVIAKIDGLNITVGRFISWAALYMVLVQFAVVILRYVFSLSFIATVESVIYAHGLLFMLGAGYTLLKDGHVRVDVFYRQRPERTKAWIDFLGAVLFILPVMALILWASFSFIIHSWQVFEGSEEAGGLPLLFLYKTVIWVFALLVTAQAIAMAGRAWLFLQDKEDDDETGKPKLYHAMPEMEAQAAEETITTKGQT